MTSQFAVRKCTNAAAFSALVLALASPTQGHAYASDGPQLFVQTRAQAEEPEPFEGDNNFSERTVSGAFAGTLGAESSAQASSLGLLSSNARAYAGYGVLGVSANGSALYNPAATAPTVVSSEGVAIASFRDDFRIDVSGMAGQRGTLIVPLTLTGGSSVGLAGPLPRSSSQRAFTEWGFSLVTVSYDLPPGQSVLGITEAFGDSLISRNFNEASVYSTHQVGYGDVIVDQSYANATVPTLWTGVQIIFGSSLGLDVRMGATAGAVAGNTGLDLNDPTFLQTRSATANVDFLHTFRWGGVQQVLDAGGRPVTGWTMSSASGTNYALPIATAVPEPAAWMLVLAGLLFVGTQRRRPAAAATA